MVGRVTRIYSTGVVQVYINGRGWVFNPLCLEPAPGETAPPHTPDPNSKDSYFCKEMYLVACILLTRLCNISILQTNDSHLAHAHPTMHCIPPS